MEQVCLEHCRILASHNTPTQSLGQPQPSFPTPHAHSRTHTRCPRRMVLPPCENHHYVLTHSRQLIKERCCSLHLCRFALLQECTQANSDSHQWPPAESPQHPAWERSWNSCHLEQGCHSKPECLVTTLGASAHSGSTFQARIAWGTKPNCIFSGKTLQIPGPHVSSSVLICG